MFNSSYLTSAIISVQISGLLLLTCVFTNCAMADTSRVIATGGATAVEGSAGGGLVPWAVINGYNSSDEWSANAMATQVKLNDFSLNVTGASLSFDNRVELSVVRQTFDLDTLGGELAQGIIGLKYKFAGDLLYTQLPQLSIGMQYKRLDDFTLPSLVGAKDDWGLDVYLAATQLYFDALAGHNLLLNGTVRATKANELGLLGFGSQTNDDYELVIEVSAALLLRDNLALGIEYRQKPNQLNFAREDDWQDVFIALFINKNLSVTAAYVQLGSIAGFDNQQGWYLSLEGTI
jgi:hypothetical protein